MKTHILLYATLTWPSAARYAAGFHASGCEVYALAPQGAPVSASRYIAGFHRYRPFHALSSLRAAIAATSPDIIASCDDRAVTHLLQLYEEERTKPNSRVAEVVRRSLGYPEAYSRVLSRSGALSELRNEGIRAPVTLPVESAADLETSLDTLGLPAVLKADGSWGGEGVVIAQTREQARAAYVKLAKAPSRLKSVGRAVNRRDSHFLLSALNPKANTICIQAFVPGTQAASAFAARNGEILAMFHYDVLTAQGRLGPPKVIRRVDDAEMDNVVRTVAKHFGLSGMHGLDYIRDPDGAVHLVEINPRATRGGTLPFGEGRDLPSALAQTMSAAPVGRRSGISTTLVYFADHGGDVTDIREAYEEIPRDDPEVLRVMDAERRRSEQSYVKKIRQSYRTAKSAG